MIKDLASSELEIKYNEPLSHYTFTKTGGPADILAFPKTEAALEKLVVYAQQQALPLTVIGNASNLIVQDGGIRGLTVITTEMKTIEAKGNTIVAQAGAKIIDVSEMALAASLTGLEFAAGIPGSVGGAVFMNAGAYGGEIKDAVTAYRYLDANGNLVTVNGADMGFSYRHSALQENGGVVVSATFTLEPGDFTAIKAKMTDLNARRASKQPLEYPSCGSVFKRPADHFVGPLIQEAGLQGKIIGGAQISMKHAGFIVNIDHATATDYMAMIHFVQKEVWAKFQIKLEPEVRIIGEPKA
ncbi:UDP-N-acetylmuramate dehydrogenase [Agrilactobacillus yilanensis]|uniref:UDP-N-acetylenolpyruvoylglucosamine reductase n=1 Tax=Agrilactobacillus yilanensis TaxID=2485997 RepID=A0ABW4JC74_9LACO|nr:UDP-N-acetylmuramate dehydrogenase [Agrilactobacillus yilanensis]